MSNEVTLPIRDYLELHRKRISDLKEKRIPIIVEMWELYESSYTPKKGEQRFQTFEDFCEKRFERCNSMFWLDSYKGLFSTRSKYDKAPTNLQKLSDLDGELSDIQNRIFSSERILEEFHNIKKIPETHTINIPEYRYHHIVQYVKKD